MSIDIDCRHWDNVQLNPPQSPTVVQSTYLDPYHLAPNYAPLTHNPRVELGKRWEPMTITLENTFPRPPVDPDVEYAERVAKVYDVFAQRMSESLAAQMTIAALERLAP